MSGPRSFDVAVWKRRLYTSIGERVKVHRLKAALSREQVAERLECSVSAIRNVEDCGLSCPVYLLVQLADLFDCSLDELVPVEELVPLAPGVSPRVQS